MNLKLTLSLVFLVGIGSQDASSINPDELKQALDDAVPQLRSPNQELVLSTRKYILSLGPEAVSEIRARRKVNTFFEDTITQYDSLIHQGAQENDEKLALAAANAVRFFKAYGAVEYLLLGLDSKMLNIQQEALRGILKIDATELNARAKQIVSSVLRYMEDGSWEQTLDGERNAGLIWALGDAEALISKITGVKVKSRKLSNSAVNKEFIAQAKQWLEKQS